MQLIEYDTGYGQLLTPRECKDIIVHFQTHGKKLPAKTRIEGVDYEPNYESGMGEITPNRKGHVSSLRDFPHREAIEDYVYEYADMTGIKLYQPNNREDVPHVSWQFTVYDEVGDWFGEHKDHSVQHFTNVWYNRKERDDPQKWTYRKVSVTVQLSDPKDYQGCVLKLRQEREKMFTYPNEQGSVLCFPSYADHKVDPLIDGKRYAMVGWFFGPHWR